MNVINNQKTEQVLNQAVEFDTNHRYTEALASYQEGIHLTNDIIKAGKREILVDSNGNTIEEKLEKYVERAEKIRTFITEQKEKGEFHEEFTINDDATGYSYKNLMGRFLDDEIEFIVIKDPYIRNFEQCQNFIRLCELLVQRCLGLSNIALITSRADDYEGEQASWFDFINNELNNYRVKLTVKYSNEFEEIGITLSNGWIIKTNRGLDIYKPITNIYSLGAFDLGFRPCYETTVVISHTNDVEPLRKLFKKNAFISFISNFFSWKSD